MPSFELGIATLPSEIIRAVINVSAQMTQDLSTRWKLIKSKINFKLLLIYNFTVNKYRLACKGNEPRVLLALEKQIGGRNLATFTALCRPLS